MARKRMIDPQIWDSCFDKNLNCQDFAVLIAAISSADDEGRGKISMIERNLGKMLKEKELKSSLNNLNDTIVIYEEVYYYLPNWKEYQALNRPKASKFPTPPDLIENKSSDESVINHGLISDDSVSTHEKCTLNRSRIRSGSGSGIEGNAEQKEPQQQPPELQTVHLFAVWGRAPDPGEKQHALNLLKQFSFEQVKRAFYTASSAGQDKKNIRYVRGILNSPDREKQKINAKENRKIGAS